MVAVFFERLHSLSENRPSMLGPRLVFDFFPRACTPTLMGGFHLMIALLILRHLQFDNKLCSQGWVQSAPAQKVPHFIVSGFQHFGWHGFV